MELVQVGQLRVTPQELHYHLRRTQSLISEHPDVRFWRDPAFCSVIVPILAAGVQLVLLECLREHGSSRYGR